VIFKDHEGMGKAHIKISPSIFPDNKGENKLDILHAFKRIFNGIFYWPSNWFTNNG